jgi:hypothetical protein
VGRAELPAFPVTNLSGVVPQAVIKIERTFLKIAFESPLKTMDEKKPTQRVGFFPNLVPRRGLEPPHLAALVPETSASTNFATWATEDQYYKEEFL